MYNLHCLTDIDEYDEEISEYSGESSSRDRLVAKCMIGLYTSQL